MDQLHATLDIFTRIRDDVKSKKFEFTDPYCGICRAYTKMVCTIRQDVDPQCTLPRFATDLWLHVEGRSPVTWGYLVGSWPKYSGSVVYPVPSVIDSHIPTTVLSSPETMYHSTDLQWEGEYGKLRMELLEHIIKELEEMVTTEKKYYTLGKFLRFVEKQKGHPKREERIYDAFENDTEESVRQVIYDLGFGSPEPFRAGMKEMGYVV